MGYTFVKIPYPGRKHVEKSTGEAEILRKLRSYIDQNSPELVYLLTNLHRAQGEAITYKELREAILAGAITAELFLEWEQDYTKFVSELMHPRWLLAMDAATEDIRRKYPDWQFDPMGDGVRSWTTKHGAEFVTNCTQSQIMGLRAVVQRAAVLQDINVDTLARAVRPMVGLYHQQAVANMKYFEKLIGSGVKEKKALDLSLRYAARQHRYRGYLIARTELAFAYNQGVYEGAKQAIEMGYANGAHKVWRTAATDRVCDECRRLEGVTIDIDDDFDFKTKLATPMNPTIRKAPPAHPNCMCSYEIVFE